MPLPIRFGGSFCFLNTRFDWEKNMKLYEYEAKEIFGRFGIPVPAGFLVTNLADVREAASKIGKPVVMKAQILSGGRGKAGGIKTATDPEEAEKIATVLLGENIKGFNVKKILVEEKLDSAQEIYLGVAIDAGDNSSIVMVCSQGGVEIEEVADKAPEKIYSMHVSPLSELRGYEARKLLKKAGLGGRELVSIGEILCKLHKVFEACDAELAEINPLIMTRDNRFVAADARLNIDDHSLYRQHEVDPFRPDRFESVFDLEGKRRGLNYIDLDGNVAVLGNGAGLTMALIDMIKLVGLQPACFLDTGGGASRERMRNAFELLMLKADSDSTMRSVLFNINLQITSAEEAAQGIADVFGTKNTRVLVAGVIHGTEAEKAADLLKNTGIKLCSDAREAIEIIKQHLGQPSEGR